MLRQNKNVWLLLNQNETSMHNNALVLSWYLWKLRNKKIVMNINNTLMKNGSNDNDGHTTVETQNGLTPNLWCTCLLRRSSASIFFVVSAVIFILATVGDPFIDRLWWHTRCDHIKTLIPYALDARANNCDKRAILASSWAPNIRFVAVHPWAETCVLSRCSTVHVRSSCKAHGWGGSKITVDYLES